MKMLGSTFKMLFYFFGLASCTNRNDSKLSTERGSKPSQLDPSELGLINGDLGGPSNGTKKSLVYFFNRADPYVAEGQSKRDLYCTATVVDSHAILTAAHCLIDPAKPDVIELLPRFQAGLEMVLTGENENPSLLTGLRNRRITSFCFRRFWRGSGFRFLVCNMTGDVLYKYR